MGPPPAPALEPARAMEVAFPALSHLSKAVGCLTHSKHPEHAVDATNTPFRAPSLLTAGVARTCTELVLAGCELEVLPEVIGLFYGLRKLDLSENRLAELPPDIGNLYSLVEINLSSNMLRALPDEFRHIFKLESLMLYSNLLTALPDIFGDLTAITEFNIFNNRLLKLPPSLSLLTQCEEFNFAANKVSCKSRVDADARFALALAAAP